MTQRVAVIDYGMGNLHSVASALEHVGATEVVVSHEPQAIWSRPGGVPGVGGIRDCMEAIRRLGCDQLLDQVLSVDRKPVLAICVGMQALMSRSEENGGVACLDVLPGKVAFFGEAHQSDDGERLKVPHMGWNAVQPVSDHPLWRGIEPDTRFYLFTATTWCPITRPLSPAPLTTASRVVRRLRRRTCLQRSSTREEPHRGADPTSKTFSTGTAYARNTRH